MSEEKKCILLVEDEVIIATAEAELLQRYGFTVILEFTGEGAVEVFRNQTGIDMVLMDIDLGPGMDGTEAAEIILRDHDIPLVFLSSHTEKELVDKTGRITNYGYILKTAGETVLLACIDMAFKLHDATVRLRESEGRYRLLADNSLDVIWTMDLAGMYTYISPSVLTMTGWTQEEACRMTMREYILPEYLDDFMKQLARELSLPADKRATSKYLTFRQYRKDGAVIDVETNLSWVRDRDGIPVGIQGSSRDITYRTRINNELSNAEHRYQVIIENLSIIVFTLNRDGIVTYISPNVHRYGYGEVDIIGHRLLEFIHPDDHASAIDGYLRAIQNGEEFPQYFRMIGKGGEIVRMLENSRTVYDKNGDASELVGFLLDVTKAIHE
jgi:PAS domain S-box-containing protein